MDNYPSNVSRFEVSTPMASDLYLRITQLRNQEDAEPFLKNQ